MFSGHRNVKILQVTVSSDHLMSNQKNFHIITFLFHIHSCNYKEEHSEGKTESSKVPNDGLRRCLFFSTCNFPHEKKYICISNKASTRACAYNHIFTGVFICVYTLATHCNLGDGSVGFTIFSVKINKSLLTP